MGASSSAFNAGRPVLLSIFVIIFSTALAISLGLWWSDSKPASADHIPEPPDEFIYRATFATSQPDLFGPNGAQPLIRSFPLLDFSWNKEESIGDITTFGKDFKFAGFTVPVPTASFGGELGGGTSGRVAVGAKVRGFENGQIDVRYPIEASLFVPKDNKYRRGDKITIGSSWRLLAGGRLDATAPDRGSVSLEGTFGLDTSAFIEICFVVCTGRLNLLPITIPLPDIPANAAGIDLSPISQFLPSQLSTSIPETTKPLVDALDLGPERVTISPRAEATAIIDALEQEDASGVALSIGNSPALRTMASMLKGTPAQQQAVFNDVLKVARNVRAKHPASRNQQIGALEFILANFTPYGCCTGEVGLPRVKTTVTDNGRRLFASASDKIIDMTIDPVAFIESPVPLAFGLNSCDHFPDAPLPGCTELGFTILGMPIDVALSQSSKFTFTPTPRVALQFSEPVDFVVSPCNPDNSLNPADPVVCSGRSSRVIYDLGSNLTITVPSGNFHLGNATPTFSLPSTLSNNIRLDLEASGKLKAGEVFLKTPDFQLIPPILFLKKICAAGECTPEIRYPGLKVPAINVDFGPVLERSLPGLSINDSAFPVFDRSSQPWVLGGFNTVTGTRIDFDAEVKPIASFTAPTVLDEGEEGTFTATGTDLDVNVGEFLTYSWSLGDGISDFGDKIFHFYADNGDFTVTMVADDEHQLPGVASETVRVNNVAPTLIVGGNNFDEGSLADLSLPPFNRQLLTNAGAEQGTTGWTVSDALTTEGYGPQGSSRPVRAEVLVDTSTPGYYANLGLILDGSAGIFPANPAGLVTFFDGTSFGGGLITFNSDSTTFDSNLFDNFYNNGIRVYKTASSVAVSAGTAVSIHQNTSFSGYSRSIGSNVSNLSQLQSFAYFETHTLFFNCHEGQGFLVGEFCLEGAFGITPAHEHTVTHKHAGKKFHTHVTDPAHCHGTFIAILNICVDSDGNNIGFNVHSFVHAHHFVDQRVTNDIASFKFTNLPPIFTPTVSSSPQPNLTAAASRLGTWLGRLRPSGGTWSAAPRTIPSTWTRRSENAIVYEIDAGEGGLTNLVGHFAVDNGIWVWVDGVFKFGAVEPGTNVSLFEYASRPLGDLTPGKHYVQILRSDTHIGTGYNVLITGNTNGGRPGVDTPGSFFREDSYFFGGAGTAGGTASQTIDVSEGADLIDAGEVVFELIGYLGGHSVSDDRVGVAVILKDASGTELGRGQIGPLTSDDRGGVTRLKRLTRMGAVPPGTRSVEVLIAAIWRDGSDTDGYVDDLTLRLLAPSGAVIRDVGLGDTHSGTVLWGDEPVGALPEPGLIDQEPGFALMLGAHIYVDQGTYTVSVTAQDDDGGQASGSFNNTVNNVAPLVTGVTNFFAVSEPGTNVVAATFKDPGVNDAPWTATINWGDGTIEPGTVANGQVRGSHTYNAVGAPPDFLVHGSVTVTDKDGGTSTGYFTNFVVNSFQEITGVHASPDRDVPQGTPIIIDDGGFKALGRTDVTYEYSYDFGDTTSFGPVPVTPNPAPGAVVGGLTAPDHTYGELGQFVVTITVVARGPQGGFVAVGTDNFVVTVSNVAPTVNAGGPAAVGEGVVLTRVAGFTDPGFDDTHRASIDWGDGSPSTRGIVDEEARTITGSHAYADNGTHTVTITAEDNNGGVSSGDFLVTVSNLDPVTEAGASQTVTEGDIVTLDPATFTDSGDADTHTATIDWNDGTLIEAGLILPGRQVGGSHVYADNRSYTVTVCVTDDELATDCDTLIVSVGNSAPVVFGGSNKSVQEGETATISQTAFFDAGSGDTHTATIFWGDGSSSPGTVDQSVGSVTASHEYANDGIYAVTINVCDDDGGCGEGNLQVTVSNIATEIVDLQLQSVGPVHVEGLPVTLTAPINDKGTLDTHTATIDWGDGTPIDTGSVAETPFGPPGSGDGADGTVTGSHNYADNGSYTVTLCVSDDDIATCQTEEIEVTNATPVVEAGGNITVDEGTFVNLGSISTVGQPSFINLPAATFTDSGFDSTTIPSEENFTVTLDWGDGTTEPDADITFVETPGSAGILTSGTIEASHAYGNHGTYTLTVCVTDDDHDLEPVVPINGLGCDTTTVTVNNVAPTLDAGRDRTVLEGSFFALNPATFGNAGYDGEYTATIDWGDGNTEPTDDIGVVGNPAGEGTPQTGFVQASHHYGDNGTYTVTVCLNDGRTVVCDTMPVIVSNVAPTVDAGPDQEILAGQFVVDIATFSDPGFDNPPAATAEDFTSNIDWGDGSPGDTGTITETPGSEGIDTTGDGGTHRYLLPGVYTVVVTVCDDDGGCDSDTRVVTVRAIVLLIDEDSIDNGAAAIEELAFVQGLSGGDPAVLVNDVIANPGVRSPLPIPGGVVIPANPSGIMTGTIIGSGALGGTVAPLLTGQVGDEGWFALQTISGTWATAGPSADGLRNYIQAGPGLGTGANPEVLLDKVPDVRPLRAAELSTLVGLTACAVVYDGDIGINYDPLLGNLQGANLGLVAFNILDLGAPPANAGELPGVTIQILPTNVVCDESLTLPPFGPSTPVSGSVVDGYDEKEGKTLGELGKTYVVQASDNDWANIESGHYVSYQFSNPTIPAGATITSVKIYVEHWEESNFLGTVQWKVGTGWPGAPVEWDNIGATLRIGEDNEAEDSWDVTGAVNTPKRVRDMELLIQNNSSNGKKTKLDYVYAEVEWFKP